MTDTIPTLNQARLMAQYREFLQDKPKCSNCHQYCCQVERRGFAAANLCGDGTYLCEQCYVPEDLDGDQPDWDD